jgi:membrane-bound lytic murein transglycosylase MltF
MVELKIGRCACRLFLIASFAMWIAVTVGCGSKQAPQDAATKEPPKEAPPAPQSAINPQATPLEQRLATEKWHGDLEEIRKRRLLRVLVAPNKLGFCFNGAEMQGAIYDTVREFEAFLNKKLNTGNLAINAVFIPAGRDRLIPMLAEGRGDLVATLIGVSEERAKAVDFSDAFYDKAKGIIVSGPGVPPLSRLEDLSGREVYYFKNTIPYEKLTALSETFKKEGRAPIALIPADETLQSDDLIEMVNAGLVPMTVAEDRIAQFWSKVFPKLELNENAVVAEGSRAWALQKNRPQLMRRERVRAESQGRDSIRKHGGAEVPARCQLGSRCDFAPGPGSI